MPTVNDRLAIQVIAAPNGFPRGVAERSESCYLMPAGGRHTSANSCHHRQVVTDEECGQ